MKNKRKIIFVIPVIVAIVLIMIKTNINTKKIGASVNVINGEISIKCDTNILTINNETNCLVTGNLNDLVTSVSGKLISTSNIQISNIQKDDFWQGEVNENILQFYCLPSNGTNFNIASFKAKAIGAGSGTISFTSIDDETKLNIGNSEWGEVFISEANYAIQVNSIPSLSSINTLDSLSVSNTSFAFNKNITSYSVTVENNVSNVNISAVATDSKAVISGLGNKNLSVGNNSFDIVVKAENNDEKKYTINVFRKDSNTGKNSDSSLKKLSVSNVSLSPEFSSNVVNYSASVDYSIKTVTISAVKNNNKATISGTGTKQLKVGDNKFNVIVMAEDGSKTTYTITITRNQSNKATTNIDFGTSNESNQKNETVSSNTSDTQALLQKLVINDKEILLSDDKFKYNFSVLNEITKLKIEAKTKSDKSIVTISGHKDLVVGKNVVTILVTNGNSKNTYTIDVTRKDIEKKLSNESKLQFVVIENYDIGFEPEIYNYNLKIKTEDKLNFNYFTKDENANVIIKGNNNLQNGSVISFIVTAEDGSTSTYYISIKKSNSSLFVTLIIIITSIAIIGIFVLLKLFYKKNKSFEDIFKANRLNP